MGLINQKAIVSAETIAFYINLKNSRCYKTCHNQTVIIGLPVMIITTIDRGVFYEYR